jgi:5-methyltetrahydrofolate--homocysteine methyltransferase
LDFRNFLSDSKVVLFDGAMGTELAKRSLEMSGINNLSNPSQVLEVHQEYIRAGTEVLITNTLTMNRINLESHGINIDVKAVNLAGVKLAKQAVNNGQFVLGDISSTGQLLEPYGDYSEEQFYNNFKEQATILAEGGADGFIIETMIDLREAICALQACRDISNLPIIVSMSFSQVTKGGRTVMGNTVSEIVEAVEKHGADAVGANCGELGLDEMAEIAKMYNEATSLPIIIQPNAGKPTLVNDQTKFEMKPEEFAHGLQKWIDNGARMIGGCCGTSPDHIRAIKQRLKTIPD